MFWHNWSNYFKKNISKYGLNGTELQWFTNYLNERTQVVTINGKIYNTKLNGVPQGSKLGPLLFTIFINDFPSCLSNAFCNIFADDTMIGVSDKSNHVDELFKKLFSQLYILRKLKQILPTDDINCVYYGIFQNIIDYCITVWGSAAQKYLCKIQKLQNRAARLLAQNFDWNIRGIDIVRGLGWQNGKERYYFLSCCLTYKSINNLAPYYLSDLFSSVAEYHTVSTRNATNNTIQQPRCNNSLYESSLSVNESRLWNNLPL